MKHFLDAEVVQEKVQTQVKAKALILVKIDLIWF